MVLFLATFSLQKISPELYNGQDRRRQPLERVPPSLPGIRPTFVFMFMMVAIWSFLVFDYVWQLTQGGTVVVRSAWGPISTNRGVQSLCRGYAAAIGLTMSFFSGIIILIFVTLRKRGWEI
ncbi:MAG: hypothetical protein R2854_29555 [Caldilineaceae bacterium]